MTRNELANLLVADRSGNIFSVDFIKRTNGELRHMVCRKGVTFPLKGGPPAYNFSDHGLICVYDLQKMGYRTIPLESLIRVKMHGKVFEITEC